jgi:hypothetical protein
LPRGFLLVHENGTGSDDCYRIIDPICRLAGTPPPVAGPYPPAPAPQLFMSYAFNGQITHVPNQVGYMPIFSHELLITAVEMVCYFCTAIGVMFAFLFGVRM